MHFKSLSIAEWGNTIVTEPVAHWWKPAAFAVLWPGCWWWLSRSSVLVFPVSASAASKPLLWANKQRKVQWKLGKWGPKTDLQLLITTIGAVKDNEMKIFKIITLKTPHSLVKHVFIMQHIKYLFSFSSCNSNPNKQRTWHSVSPDLIYKLNTQFIFYNQLHFVSVNVVLHYFICSFTRRRLYFFMSLGGSQRNKL